MIFLGTIFDIVLILTLVISIIIGCKKGLFCIVKRFRVFFASFLAWQLKLTGFVKAIVGKLFRIDRDYFYEIVQTEFGDKLSENIHNTTLSSAEKFDNTFGKLGGLLSNAKEYFMQRINEGADNLIADITEYVTDAIYNLVYGAIGFALLFVVFFIIFTVLYHILNKVFNTGVLGVLNRTLGGVLGALTGVIWMWLLSIIFVKLFPLILSTDAVTIAGGALGIVRWFVEDFFLSILFRVRI